MGHIMPVWRPYSTFSCCNFVFFLLDFFFFFFACFVIVVCFYLKTSGGHNFTRDSNMSTYQLTLGLASYRY